MRRKREQRSEFEVVQLVDSQEHYKKGDAAEAVRNARMVIDDDGMIIKDRKGTIPRRPTKREVEEAQVVLPLRRKDD